MPHVLGFLIATPMSPTATVYTTPVHCMLACIDGTCRAGATDIRNISRQARGDDRRAGRRGKHRYMAGEPHSHRRGGILSRCKRARRITRRGGRTRAAAKPTARRWPRVRSRSIIIVPKAGGCRRAIQHSIERPRLAQGTFGTA